MLFALNLNSRFALYNKKVVNILSKFFTSREKTWDLLTIYLVFPCRLYTRGTRAFSSGFEA